MEKWISILVVAAAAALILFLSNVRKKRIQPYIDDFARAFCEVSDHLLGGTASFGMLQTEWSGNQLMRVLPAEQQSEAVAELFNKGVDEYAMERIRRMFELRLEAQKHLSTINLIGKKLNSVMNHVYDMANISLSVINDQNLLLKKEEVELLHSFLNKQNYIRNTTLASVVSEKCKAEFSQAEKYPVQASE